MYIYLSCISNVIVLLVCAKEIYWQLLRKVQLDWNQTVLPVSTEHPSFMKCIVTAFAVH